MSGPKQYDLATTKRDRLRQLADLGIRPENIRRTLKVHGLNEGRIGWLPEDVWRVRLQEIIRDRKSNRSNKGE